MNIKFVSACLALAFASFSPFCQAGSYSQPFTGSANGSTNLGDGSTIASNDGIASVQGSPNNYLRLTQNNSGGTSSAFKLPELDPGQEVESFTFTFELQIGGTGTFADGVSLTFGAIPSGNGGGEAGFAADNGLVISWDTYDNGGDEPSVEVFSDGVSIDNNTYSYSSTAGTWVPVVVHWDGSGLDLSYDGSTLATNLATPGFSPSAGDTFAFSGRTGGANQNTYLDNISVVTTTQSPITTGGPIISEFVADNANSLDDEDLDSPDWIEVYNGQNSTVNLGGYYLTNDSANKTMWQFPSQSLVAFEYFTLFASGKDRAVAGSQLHTNFTLSKAGGYLALIAPDMVTVVSEFNFGIQVEDIAYGELGQARTLGYLETPTPDEKNVGLQASGAPAESVQFDKTGGVFSNSIALAILPPVSPSAVVRYTTNGTVPDASSPVYSSAFNITNTTTVRARVFEAGKLPGEIKSRTMIELASDVQNFTSNLPIVIADSSGVNIDLASNPGAPRPFRNVYTVVIDRDPADGLAHIDGITDFTGRGGMHVRGQSSSGFPKKQYSWETWNNEDQDRDVSILGMPSESDWILHAPYSDKTLMRNVIVYDLARQIHGDGGGMRSKFVELFFNMDGGAVSMSDYRGVYVVMEKIKINSNRVDIAKVNETVTDPELITGGYIFKKDKPPHSQPWSTATEGVPLDTHDPDQLNTAQFNYLTGYVNDFESALHGASFDDPATGYAAYIDVPSFIDMHLFVETFKEIDGYRISTYFSKDRGEKIRALPVWDYNLALGNADYLQGENPAGWYYTQLTGTNYFWYQRLFEDAEFELAYWDRFWSLRRDLFTTPNLMAEIDRHDAELDGANGIPNAVTRNFDEWNILGSYVWPNASGSGSRTTHQLEVDWMKDWLSDRLDWIETQSRGIGGLAQPPVFNQYGGDVAGGFDLTMSDTNSWGGAAIYFTTDGSDPRVAGNSAGQITTFVSEEAGCSAFIPTVGNAGGNLGVADWTNPAEPANQANWITGFTQGVGYENSSSNRYDPLIGTDVLTEMRGNSKSCYVRIPFSISAQSEIDALSILQLQMRFDDGFVAYLNGEEIARANAPTAVDYTSGATVNRSDALAEIFTNFPVSQFISELKVGDNMLAIHGLNDSSGSSDTLYTAQLIGTAGGGNAPSSTAEVYTTAIDLASSTEINARVFDGTRWSPLSSGLFIVDAVPATAANIVISELDYNPQAPSQVEIDAGFIDNREFEYIELMNIDPLQSVTLEGVSFFDGISFAGFDNTLSAQALVLPPGGRIVLVDNLAAFGLRHGPSAIVSGVFSGSFSNDGEQVTLLDVNGVIIKDFTYNDVEPWPIDADGNGYSLVLNDPTANPDHSNPASWRSSVAIGGSAGGADSLPFAGNPLADVDSDGVNAFYEYAAGTSDTDSDDFSLPDLAIAAVDVGGVVDDYLMVDFQVSLAAEGIEYTVEESADLLDWESPSLGLSLQSTTNNGNGTATVRYRSVAPVSTMLVREFYRIKVSG